ncbi:hypothetical protein STM14_3466 [Salmonella enterica subsp. enterica serovar Typhimurium str. 14028S]|uniref:Uncharacterized protein n=2 Tax=Salmonella enterica I TaxID=59201 RepID=A0A0F6B5T6_SALT1|nr:hypothetical protein SPAB_03567 [Salmonella enterica subsp. enterica serovar Paratyphi B str. SPB7]ACY89880.1 hypothetical protein STM14_3466 [Salmonella enterica subsp. enterica serovar Typhimurium str. 14028S]
MCIKFVRVSFCDEMNARWNVIIGYNNKKIGFKSSL